MLVISFRPIMIIESFVSKVYIQITPVTLSAKRPSIHPRCPPPPPPKKVKRIVNHTKSSEEDNKTLPDANAENPEREEIAMYTFRCSEVGGGCLFSPTGTGVVRKYPPITTPRPRPPRRPARPPKPPTPPRPATRRTWSPHRRRRRRRLRRRRPGRSR